MTVDDSTKSQCAHSGMKGQVGGFQNPGVCLQAFPSFLPLPLPPSFTRSIFRAVILCSRTPQKRLLRRLYSVWLLRFVYTLIAKISKNLQNSVSIVEECETASCLYCSQRFWTSLSSGGRYSHILAIYVPRDRIEVFDPTPVGILFPMW